ncbi:MAG: hypothetical protein LBD06_10645 [Candidatus Accumulibacter sp.]|nr:hypothetical protein [Accumulibacter sp.]
MPPAERQIFEKTEDRRQISLRRFAPGQRGKPERSVFRSQLGAKRPNSSVFCPLSSIF